MNQEHPSTPRSGRRRGLVILLLAVAVASLVGWRGWVWWQARHAQEQAVVDDAEQRVAALEARVEALRRDQRAQTQRLQDAAATNRVLRDEVLGLGQRGALLEESVAKLTDPNRHGAQALRLDEVELLLSQASQRLDIARDLEGARRAYALAAGALDGVDDHRLLNLKQTLAQERIALDALGTGPQAAKIAQLDKFATSLAALGRERPVAPATGERTRWQRLLSPLVDVTPSRDSTIIAPSERTAAEAALQIELSLARAALERGDAAGFRAALGRIDGWMTRLWPDSPALRQGRVQLQALGRTDAVAEPAVLGSTLQQLRALRSAGLQLRPLPAPSAPGPESTEVMP
ncbi:hypothetical protein OVA13_14335 [Pseudoxanthomonas sp. SL93]|uniref:hypothetical protein n=1 Tax=Pseudoxanthomonas sp. SL93 TaxID=2995142 RepID=UPI00226ED335|nr:hypothetical protein [Pseudoxanthomonas sp. SL93]WAC62558.1 hypothetical protein OVA13_14335 [Pseudoxanthomonas sp. SL93]